MVNARTVLSTILPEKTEPQHGLVVRKWDNLSLDKEKSPADCIAEATQPTGVCIEYAI